VAQLGPGSFFGELALFDDAPRNASVAAAGPAALAVFSRARFRTALDDIPALRDSLLRGMARRLHDLDSKT
jgi:CRP-like cAMP-binding protein